MQGNKGTKAWMYASAKRYAAHAGARILDHQTQRIISQDETDITGCTTDDGGTAGDARQPSIDIDAGNIRGQARYILNKAIQSASFAVGLEENKPGVQFPSGRLSRRDQCFFSGYSLDDSLTGISSDRNGMPGVKVTSSKVSVGFNWRFIGIF
jgi:hypothetical protein